LAKVLRQAACIGAAVRPLPRGESYVSIIGKVVEDEALATVNTRAEERVRPAGHIEVRVLGPVLGAEIIGIDVAQPVPPETLQMLDDALNRYKVTCLRDQHITQDQMIAFS
jgi:hypothetical protein